MSAAQALLGGSVVYRLFAHFMKDDEFRAQIEKLVPKDKLPLIAAGTVAAGAVGLIGQRRAAHNAETELAHALDEMTDEAKDLRRENERLRGGGEEAGRPDVRVREPRHEQRIEQQQRRRA